MGILELAELVMKLAMKYGPDVYAAAKRWVEAVMADPMTPAEEIAALRALLVRADTWEQRVIDAPDIPRRAE